MNNVRSFIFSSLYSRWMKSGGVQVWRCCGHWLQSTDLHQRQSTAIKSHRLGALLEVSEPTAKMVFTNFVGRDTCRVEQPLCKKLKFSGYVIVVPTSEGGIPASAHKPLCTRKELEGLTSKDSGQRLVDGHCLLLDVKHKQFHFASPHQVRSNLCWGRISLINVSVSYYSVWYSVCVVISYITLAIC